MKLICNKSNDFFYKCWAIFLQEYSSAEYHAEWLYKEQAIYSLYLEPVNANENEIKKLISSLKSNIPGYDMIGSDVLKWCVDYFRTAFLRVQYVSARGNISRWTKNCKFYSLV